jgi:hypothetical protein
MHASLQHRSAMIYDNSGPDRMAQRKRPGKLRLGLRRAPSRR